jgi:hypothetical protein
MVVSSPFFPPRITRAILAILSSSVLMQARGRDSLGSFVPFVRSLAGPALRWLPSGLLDCPLAAWLCCGSYDRAVCHLQSDNLRFGEGAQDGTIEE